jgi:hypothetical protein
MTAKLFADATMALEDMHSIAVEGQARDVAPDMQWVLVGHLRAGVAGLEAILGDIAACFGKSRTVISLNRGQVFQ